MTEKLTKEEELAQREEALNKENTSQSRIRALELLGKTSDVGLFIERIETITKDRTPEEIMSEIEEKLEKVIGSTT